MRRLPRRLALWGGAAVIAGAGFAFMDANNVFASSAGQGAGSVTGYTVSSITYTYGTPTTGSSTSPYCYGNTQGNPYNCYVTKVAFLLTANSSAPSARTKPTSVVVGLTDTTQLIPNTQNPASLQDGQCTITWWSATTGKGHVTCSIKGNGYVHVSALTQLNVEANQ